MRLQLIRRFEVSFDASPVVVPACGERLLALLAISRVPARRCKLAQQLWPAVESRRAFGNLRSVLWRLPKEALPFIALCDDSLALHSDVECDLSVFESASVVLPEPDLLPGWYDDWVVVERERLQHRYLNHYQRQAGQSYEVGEFALAVRSALKALRVDPLNEATQIALLRGQMGLGNYGAAFEQVQALEKALMSELGVRPSRDLYLALDGIYTHRMAS
jgi:DNA-binding SARP family transcriptional activator